MKNHVIFMLTAILTVGVYKSCVAKESQAEPLAITVSTKKIYARAGKEEKIEAVRADVGDVIEYSLFYKNVSGAKVLKPKVALPIPNGYVYLKGSAAPNLASSDADHFLVWVLPDIEAGATIPVSARLKLIRKPSQ